MNRKRILKFYFCLLGIICFSHIALSAETVNSCVECHKDIDEKNLSEPTNVSSDDVHAKAGLTCVSCHGGNSITDDISLAKDPAQGFVGKPQKKDIPQFCAKCHADATYMKRYSPNMPTDQLSKYNVSQHGQLNVKGDKKTAVCTSCHNAHNILAQDNPASPTYALNVLDTCAKCHSDKEYMKEYGIPTNQIDDYKESVHGQALLVKGDRTSPSCKHCHGNHDAGLPQAIYVGNICSQCHSLTYELFRNSPHKAAHDSLGIPECEACHGNHKIMKTSDDMLGTGQDALCIQCHSPTSKGFKTAFAIKNSIEDLKKEILQAKESVSKVEQRGMDVEDALADIDEANNSLTKARGYIHTFSEEQVGSIVKEGETLVKKAKERALKARDDFNFRRKGYIFAILLIFIFSLTLYLRIRILEKPGKEN